jgi:hypothetical protein
VLAQYMLRISLSKSVTPAAAIVIAVPLLTGFGETDTEDSVGSVL